ncbi:MAG: OmpH family outer membrane protein, partial [Bacillota bacterium]
DMPKANEALKAEQEKLKKEFESKMAALSSDKEKQALSLQLGRQLEQKRWELLNPIMNSINTAIKDVATEKGLSVVIEKSVVLFGGQDITADVGKKVAGK